MKTYIFFQDDPDYTETLEIVQAESLNEALSHFDKPLPKLYLYVILEDIAEQLGLRNFGKPIA